MKAPKLQDTARTLVAGDKGLLAMQALHHRANCNRAARCGEYTPAMERTEA